MSTPTISSSVLFNLNTQQLTFSDNTNYSSYGVSLANVDGNIKITGSSTGIFYNNTSWVTPSIDLNATNTKAVNLPLNSSSEVVAQSYEFVYTIRVLYQLSTVNNPTSQTIRVLGDYTDVFEANDSFTIVGGANAGTYSVASSAYDSGTGYTTVTINETLADPADVSGVLNIYQEVVETQTFVYSCTLPTVSIETEVDCDCGQITSTDLTNYGITVNGTYIYPTITRTHTVAPPISPSTGQRVAGTTTSSSATILLSPIWTTVNEYQYLTTVSTGLSYAYASNFTVVATVAGSESFAVECSSELCCVYSCLSNIFENWRAAKETNNVQAEKWYKLLMQVLGAWMLYSIAKSCSREDDAETYLALIITTANTAGCTCCTGTDSEPTQVVPICGNSAISSNGSGTGGNVVVATCGNGITVTPSTVGVTTTYTLCIDTDVLNGIIADYLADSPLSLDDLSDVDLTGYGSGDFLRFDGQDWVPVSSIAISQITEIQITNPLVGQVLTYDGTNWVNDNQSGNIVAIEQATYTSTGTALQTLKSVTIPAGTLVQTGDYLDIDCEYLLTASSTTKRVLVGMSSNDSFSTAYLSNSAFRRIYVNIRFIRVSSTTVRQIWSYRATGNYLTGYGYPPLVGPTYYSDPLTYAVNNLDNAANTVQFRYDPTLSGTSGSLVDYTIKLFKL